MTHEDVVPLFDERWREAWARHLADSAELAHAARWCDVDLVLRCGGREKTFHLVAGRLSDTPAARAERIVLDGAQARWARFLQPVPSPFHNTVLAMDRRCEDFSVTGGRESLTRHLRALTVVFGAARAAATEVRTAG